MPTTQRPRIFLSYGVGDATEVAALLHRDLAARGYEVWQDIDRIGEGRPWDEVVRDGLKWSQVLLALLSPQSVRRGRDPGNATQTDSVCLDEIAYARGACHIPIVPVKVMPCETPFLIYRLHQLDFQSWKSDAVYQAGIDRICQAIEDACRGEARERSWGWLTSPWDFEPFLYEKRKRFQGREWLFKEIDDWRANGSQPALLITGGPGAGKSAIVATLIHDNPDGQVLAYHCCQANTPATLDPANFVRNLAAMIAVRIEAYDEMLNDPAIVKALQGADDDPASAFEAAILAPLHKLPVVGERRRYLLIDALDEAMTRSRQPTIVGLLASRIERFPPWLRIVATTRPEQNVLAQLRGLTPTELHTHDPRNVGDIRSFIAARLKDPALHAAVDADGRPANELIEKLVAASNGNFLYATTALKAVEAGQLDFKTIEKLPPGLGGIYQQFFDRIFGSDRTEVDFEPTRKVLETIVAAQEPLTREQIAAATGLDAKKQLPEILAKLSSFVPVREGRYSIFHKSLSDWLTDWDQAGDHAVSGRYHIDRAEGRAQLAQWCWSEYKRGPEKTSLYCLRHLAVHLHETGRDRNAQTALLNLDWLRSKLAATDANAVIADCNLFSEDQPTKLLQDSLRLCAHLLSKDKTQLPAQLLGRLSAFRQQFPAIQLLLEQASGWSDAPWLRPLTASLTPPGSTLLRTLRGHSGTVNAIVVGSDGQFVVTASDDKTLKVWELATGLVERTLEGHKDKVNDVALSPDGKFIISASSDKSVLVWPFSEAGDPRALGDHEAAVTAVAVTPDSRFVLSGSDAGLIVKWDLQNGKKVATLKGHTGAVQALTIDREGRLAASISDDRTVKIWNLQDGTLVRELPANSFSDKAVALLPNGRCLAASKVWNIETGEQILTLESQMWMDGVLAVTPDGRHAISTYQLQHFAVWDLETGAVTKQFGESFFVLSAIAVTPQEKFVVTASGNSPRVWDLQRPFLPSPHSGRLSAVAITVDEGQAVSFSSDKQFKMWDLRTYHEKGIASLPAGSEFLRYEPGTLETLLMAGDKLVLWDPRSGESKEILAKCSGITHALLIPAMQHVVTANRGDNLVRLWQFRTGTMLKELAGHTGSVSALVAVPGTNCALSASYDETMKLWNLETGDAIRTFQGHKGPVDVVVVTPDGRQAVSGSRDRTLKIWDLLTGETLHTLTGHTYSVHDVAVMREGRFVISVSGDSTAKAWSLSDGKMVAEYYADNPIHCCAVSSENGPILLGDGLGRPHFLRLDGI